MSTPDVLVILVIWLLVGMEGSSRNVMVRAQLGSVDQSSNSGLTNIDVMMSEAYTHEDVGNVMYSGYGYFKCTMDEVLAPTSTEEVSGVVKRLGGTRSVKIRVTRHGHHSSAGFTCSGRRASTKFCAGESSREDHHDGSVSVTLLLHSMNRVVSVDKERRLLSVESGMTLQSFVDAAEENGMTVPSSAIPVYGNLSIGGVVATSAHGSGVRYPVTTLGSLVRRVRWVNGKGEILTSDASTESGAREIAALVGGMGLLGVITEFTFQLDPGQSLTMVESRYDLDDTHMAADVTKVLEDETPFMIVYWRPDFGKYRTVQFTPLKDGDKLPASAPPLHPTARSAFMKAVDDDIAGYIKETLSVWEADPLDASPTASAANAGICDLGAALFTSPFLFDEADGTAVDNATLPTNRVILAPECAPKCSHQTRHMGGGVKDLEFTMKLSHLEDFVADMKTIVKSELRESTRQGSKICMPPGFMWLRFGSKSDTLLSTNTGEEDVVYIQLITIEAAASSPEKHQKGEAILQTFEQLMLCKYKARPHWGKNMERVFRHPKCHVRENYPERNFVEMLRMQEVHDPKKMFEPQLFTHVSERSGPTYYPRCASAGWCYCEADEHCPIGNVCRPSPIFPEYKICKLLGGHASQHHGHHEEL